MNSADFASVRDAARRLAAPRCLSFVLGALVFAVSTAVGQVPGVSREQMWFAPTAEDWKKPCLITFQRTYEDAEAVSKATGKPILVCINMDGEIASEHYAGVRYRQPEIAKLYEPYVTVIVSVYRHSPRDHDENGRRVLCPRFGSVTCGEHIVIEEGIYEKFSDGKRIAPRHIGVELDGKEMYDVYYRFDTDSVFASITEGITNRPDTLIPVVRGDRSIVERVKSRDVNDRIAVENAYQQGDAETRRTLLEAAIAAGDAAPTDLLRLGVFGFDVEASKLARRALAQSTQPGSVDLIAEAMRVPMEVAERDALIGALDRLGDTSPRARTLAVVHRGLSGSSVAVDIEGWSKAIEGDAAATPTAYQPAVVKRLQEEDRVLRSVDADAQLELAESLLITAIESVNKPGFQGLRTDTWFTEAQFMDAHHAATSAEKNGAKGWRLDSALAVAAYYMGKVEEAYARAEAAVSTLPAEAKGWNAMVVLGLFAEARREAIAKAVREKTTWPGQWLADVHAAYAVLAKHPEGSDSQVIAHHDFLRWLGAAGEAARALDAGIARFPHSGELHERLRIRITEEKGVDGLEPAYTALLAQPNAPRILEWFAGFAHMVAAELHRRAGNLDLAVASYDKCIVAYERGIGDLPQHKAVADGYIARAIAGKARIAFERDDLPKAAAEIIASFERQPDVAATQDGLNLSPVDTAKVLLAKLKTTNQADLAATVAAALGKLPPEMLRLPAYEREPGAESRPRRRRE